MKSTSPFQTETVMQIYLNCPNELGNKQLKQLFDISSDSSVHKHKKNIKKMMLEDGEKVIQASNVKTRTVFKYAGIDIADYKKRYLEMKKLGLLQQESSLTS